VSDPSPRAAVLSVGSELLLGDLTDTNATWLSQRLRELGVEVVHHLAVRDELDEFVAALRWLADRVDIVLIGGGLGPTSDDLTREAVAAAAGVPLEHRDDLEEHIVQRFAAMGRRMAPQNLKQARVPAGADAYDPVGTAPAFGLTLPGERATRVFALPGVPWELQELFRRDVAPEIAVIAGPRATLTRVVHVVGRGESDVAAEVEPLIAGREGVVLSFLAKSHEIQVRLTVTARDVELARAASQPVVEEVVAALGPAVAGLDEETLEDVVLRLLGSTSTTVATAESATAGDISARLGRVPGASLGLLGGTAVYATEAKHRVLGIDEDLLEAHGPVSAEVTLALASAVRERFGSDWGLAVTGCAGPTEQNGRPVGEVFWALAHPDGHVEVHERILPGDRAQIIARLGTAALDLLRRRLLER
jgi:nicotinamide-nucleotide amidase